MADNKKLIDLFLSKGLLFPTTEKEVEEFEKQNPPEEESLSNLESAEEIIKHGIQNLDQLKIMISESLTAEIEELRMIARKGGQIPQHVIDKMKTNQKGNDK